MNYVIYESVQEAIDREKELSICGANAGYYPKGERYDVGGLLIIHPTEDKAAIKIFRSEGMLTPLSQDDILPCNYEPIFTEVERQKAVDALSEDWK